MDTSSIETLGAALHMEQRTAAEAILGTPIADSQWEQARRRVRAFGELCPQDPARRFLSPVATARALTGGRDLAGVQSLPGERSEGAHCPTDAADLPPMTLRRWQAAARAHRAHDEAPRLVTIPLDARHLPGFLRRYAGTGAMLPVARRTGHHGPMRAGSASMFIEQLSTGIALSCGLVIEASVDIPGTARRVCDDRPTALPARFARYEDAPRVGRGREPDGVLERFMDLGARSAGGPGLLGIEPGCTHRDGAWLYLRDLAVLRCPECCTDHAHLPAHRVSDGDSSANPFHRHPDAYLARVRAREVLRTGSATSTMDTLAAEGTIVRCALDYAIADGRIGTAHRPRALRAALLGRGNPMSL